MPSKSSFNKEKAKKKDSTGSVDPSSAKDSSLPPSAERAHKPLYPFSYRLKKKDQGHIDKMRETFSQVKINIPLLDAIQQMPPYARFLKDLYSTKRATDVPKKAFPTFGASSIISHQIPVKYKDLNCATIFILIRD